MTSIFSLLPTPKLLPRELMGGGPPAAAGGSGGGGMLADSIFSSFKQVMGEVNRLQFTAEDHARAFAAGDVEDVHDVALAINKAKFAMDLTVRVRDKLLEAYRELSAMR